MPELPPPNSERAPDRSSLPRLMAVLVVLLGIFLLPTFLERIEYARVHGRQRAEAEISRQELQDGKLTELSRLSGLVAKRVGPSVVHINTLRSVGSTNGNDEMAQLFGGSYPFQDEGQGSGVIVDPAGFIVTNNHVIERATRIEVLLSDGRARMADLVGTDELLDIAVIKIDADNLIAAEWGDSDKLEVGALVWAIGNPFGLDRSVTFGIISAIGRPGVNALQNFLQTDAAVNPGNSGGPLVNIAGQIVGINTAIVGKSFQGVSFSIPSDTARAVYESLKKNGKVARGWLGVALRELTPELAKQYNLTETHGAIINELVPDGPAARAGVKIGDIVVSWNGQPIESRAMLSRFVAATEIGSTAKMVVLRDAKPVTLNVPVEERPALPKR